MSRTDSDFYSAPPERNVLLAELSSFLLRLDEIVAARERDPDNALELPLRRLQADLMHRSDCASWHESQRMAHAYSLAMQEAASLLEQLRAGEHDEEWEAGADLVRKALQRAVVRVRRLHD